MRRSSRTRPRKLKKNVKITLVLIIIVIFCWYFARLMNGMIDRSSTHLLNNMAHEMVYEAVGEVLEESEYDELVLISYNNQNEITSIQTDSTALNQIRTDISTKVLQELHAMEAMTLEIPIGTLTDIRFLQTRGPALNFRVMPTGYMTTKIFSEFTEAGINQTQHRLMIEITCDISCMGLLYRSSSTVTTEYVISETIIVGVVPDSYTKLLFEEKSKLGD